MARAARVATGPAAHRQPVAYSIIVPQFDCRDAGTRAVRSALDQAFARERYEVIVVGDARASGRWPQSILARCDQVVAVDADFGAVESEIALFDAGARAARGEWLYFIEGHTVLEPHALQAIDAALTSEPACSLAFGRRFNHHRTRLGALIGGNNDAHQRRAARAGTFTLGANCVIRRTLFDALGGFANPFQRFNETVLFDRALAAGARVGAVDAVLCTHHNDAGFRWLVRLVAATGHAKARYYASADGAARTARVRHPVYRWLRSPLAATLAFAPLRAAGPLAIVVAMALARRFPALAASCYRIGVGFTDVSGFCAERAVRWRARRRAVASANREPSTSATAAAAVIDVERTS
jgi:hypothetical protein